MNHISLDIETYSSVDLNKSSVYRYSEAPDFEILLLGYSVDDGPVQVVDLASGERIPAEILAALTDAGRNYCLNSGNTHTFVDNRYRNPNGTMTNYTGWNMSVSDSGRFRAGKTDHLRLCQQPPEQLYLRQGLLGAYLLPKRIPAGNPNAERLQPKPVSHRPANEPSYGDEQLHAGCEQRDL